MQEEDKLVEVLSNRILASLDRGQHVEEATFRHLFSLLAKMSSQAPPCGHPLLIDLEQDIAARYTYGDASESDGFDLGACWGALEVYREHLLASDESALREKRAHVVRKHHEMVRIVGSEPGIAQGALAKRLGQKRSNFSQKLARLDQYQIFTFTLVGKTKHLYLTRAGRETLEAVEKELRQGVPDGNRNDPRLADATVYIAAVQRRTYDGNGTLSNSSQAYAARVVRDSGNVQPALRNNEENSSPQHPVAGATRRLRATPWEEDWMIPPLIHVERTND